jgi:hypothetical protein
MDEENQTEIGGRAMTRKEAIEHWKPIIKAVFAADNAIIDEWRPRLEAAVENGDSIKVLDEYLTAVAEEILSMTTDNELTHLKN